MWILVFIFFTIVLCTKKDDFDHALKTINKRSGGKYTKCDERVDVGRTKIGACVKDSMNSERMMLLYYGSNDETSASACKHEMTVLTEISKNKKNEMMRHVRHCARPDDCISSCNRTPYYNVVPIVYGRQLRLLPIYHPKPEISFKTLDLIMYQLLEIIKYMAKQGWTHNDIKPANIIWDPITNWLTLVGMTSFSIIEPRVEPTFKEMYGTELSTSPEVYWQMVLKSEINNYKLNLNMAKSPDAFSVGYMGFRYSCKLKDGLNFFLDESQKFLLGHVEDKEYAAFNYKTLVKKCYGNDEAPSNQKKRLKLVNHLIQIDMKHRSTVTAVVEDSYFTEAKQSYNQLKYPDWSDKEHMTLWKGWQREKAMEYPSHKPMKIHLEIEKVSNYSKKKHNESGSLPKGLSCIMSIIIIVLIEKYL
eukprot:GHVL01044824.1.p1 GENE.GHVL01044824.1~~GHVL01044824.1.p1  ORF type:complete len:418 (+),score=49.55 GHVL01044824.1:52-1305(+)